ncbi:hypothetical protein MKEN_01115400 [Mycena kentingensis (nom. inval.)]|nr:hypothetical protein MKEN_01115400 [Mycena kentingensis (nom. inval.)]
MTTQPSAVLQPMSDDCQRERLPSIHELFPEYLTYSGASCHRAPEKAAHPSHHAAKRRRVSPTPTSPSSSSSLRSWTPPSPNAGTGSPSQPPKTHICEICGKGFNRPSSLRIHANTHSGATPYRCPHPGCGRAFNVSSNMRRHLRNHSKPTYAGPPMSSASVRCTPQAATTSPSPSPSPILSKISLSSLLSPAPTDNDTLADTADIAD